MKQFSTVVVAAATGAIMALLVSGLLGYRRTGVPAARIEAREFVLLDENNQRAAVLESIGGRSALRFFAGNSAPTLEMGVEKSRTVRFLAFRGKEGRVIASLSSSPPNGETTLYLGDERWETRVIMGALQTDLEATTGVNDWGLEFRKLGSQQPLFNVLVRYDDDPRRRSTAAIGLVRRDGRVWTVY